MSIEKMTLQKDIAKILNEDFRCSEFKEFIMVKTPYLYPDGDVIDIFIKEKNSSYMVSDLGVTIAWLWTNSIANDLSKKQNAMIEKLQTIYQVERYKGILIRKSDKEYLSTAVLDLCQAIIYLTHNS